MNDAAAHAAESHRWHHFESAEQQFDAGKLGMWIFLATEVLMFGGLFCAYAIYRANHPEIFEFGHRFLDVKWGGINTVVLICSSLTMAWAVRAAQLGQKKILVSMLVLTLLCACGFMGIKYVEYRGKISHGLMWGKHYQPDPHVIEEELGGHGTHAGPALPAEHGEDSGETAPARSWAEETPEASNLAPAAVAPTGFAPPGAGEAPSHEPVVSPRNVHIFFGIYFAMTGLHGVHVLAGMIVITWLLVGAVGGRFGPSYFTPVDLVGLYWHIVDMVWIFLFPLLYLIH